MDLIDRQAAIDAVWGKVNKTVVPDDWYKGIRTAVSAIKAVPSVQPEPIKAKWNAWYHGSDRQIGYSCSRCGFHHKTTTAYCPNCGSYNGGGDAK